MSIGLTSIDMPKKKKKKKKRLSPSCDENQKINHGEANEFSKL